MDNNEPTKPFTNPLLNKKPMPTNGIAKNRFTVKRVPVSAYVEMDLRRHYAWETWRSIKAPAETQVMELELHFGGANWDGAGEEADA